MNLEELLPPGEDGARAFLEWQNEALHSPAKYLGLVGGVGSGKTITACILGLALSVQIPGNRGIVLRETYTKLHDSTETVFLEVLARAEMEDVKYLEHHHHMPHRIVLPNYSEIFFRETKDPGRYLGPEYGWFFLDEASEEPETTILGLMKRLRLKRAGGYLKGMLGTNPPHKQSWFAKMFPKPGIREIKEPITGVTTKYHMIRSTTRQNRHLPPGYLADLLTNNPDAEISRIIDGHYGFTQEGKPVYPQFSVGVHVRNDGFRPKTSVIRGWDFGFHHPAATWHQLWRCSHRQLHWSILHELDDVGIEAVDFVTKVLVETAVCFPDTSRWMILDGGDRSGAQVSDKGPGPIVRVAGPPWYIKIRHRFCPIEPGLDLIRKYLSLRCPCGLPGMMIDPSCLSTIEAFQGGYHYPKNYRGNKEEMPQKDRFFDDFMDSVRYVGENFVRLEEKGPGFLDQIIATDTGIVIETPTDWMVAGWPTREATY
jgi:Terminase large subunit, T4likevirus-type, N-terminal